jgi:osmotically inducible lipoprotein OsmB
MCMMMRAVTLGLMLSIAGCGHDTGTRVATGGLIGAAGGVALGLATGGVAPAVGVLVGGGVGAAAGAVTSGRAQGPTQSNRGVSPPGTREPVVDHE